MSGSRARTSLLLATCCGICAAHIPASALAHASERGHVLLLPTGYYLLGGAVAVALSFLALAVAVPRKRLPRRWPLGGIADLRAATSWIGFGFFAVVLAAGIWGSRDPLSNPLPLAVWTLLWVGLTLFQGVLGDLWAWLNPWYGPWQLVRRLASWTPSSRRDAAEGQVRDATGLFVLPDAVAYWPAAVLFLAFAWFELVYPAPDDPARLGAVVAAYWVATFLAVILFGYDPWIQRGEFLSVFFRLVAQLGILEAVRNGKSWRVSVGWPGAKLRSVAPLPLSGVLFVLLALSSVSFDGFSKTFLWLGANGINPLEFPGRTALMGINGAGLLAACAALSSVFFLAVWLGEKLAGGSDLARAAGLCVWSLLPISLAYHFAHYLTLLLVNGQYAVIALSDPFDRGWSILGADTPRIEAGLVLGHDAAWYLWNAQAFAIIAGHALAVGAGHRMAARMHPGRREAALSQLPLTVLMIGYTVFGLWLLSTPAAG